MSEQSTKKIQGFWDNLPIWREKTPREKLLEVVNGSQEKKTMELLADVIEKKENV